MVVQQDPVPRFAIPAVSLETGLLASYCYTASFGDVDVWLVPLAQYSTHTERKPDAIVTIAKAIKSPAPVRFLHAAVVTRAMPKLPCQEGKCSTNTLPAGWYFLRDVAVAKLPNP